MVNQSKYENFSSVKELIEYYDNFIIDQWGVMHNGSIGFEHAVRAVDYLNKKIKIFLLFLTLQREKVLQLKNLQN